MAADVFRRRVHADVDAVIERAKAEQRRPRVVEHDACAARVRDCGDRGNVCTSNVSDPGDSANTSFVFGRNTSAMAAPASGS